MSHAPRTHHVPLNVQTGDDPEQMKYRGKKPQLLELLITWFY